jgi:hypothetical protein
MIFRGNRRIGSKTARAMLTWARVALLIFDFVSDSLTKKENILGAMLLSVMNILLRLRASKTCGNCGLIHHSPGKSKHFTCPQCQIEMDRDINAARNILLLYLTINIEPDSNVWR